MEEKKKKKVNTTKETGVIGGIVDFVVDMIPDVSFPDISLPDISFPDISFPDIDLSGLFD